MKTLSYLLLSLFVAGTAFSASVSKTEIFDQQSGGGHTGK